MSKRTSVLLGLLLFLGGCGKKAGYTNSDVQTCVIEGNVMSCPDGIDYILPEPEDHDHDDDTTIVVVEPNIDITIVVDTVPASEDDIDAACEKDNRNGIKCRKVKKEEQGR